MTSYLISIDTFSLSRTVFEIFDFKVFRVWPWSLTFRGHQGSKKCFTIRKTVHDFLSNFYWHFLSISYHFRENAGQYFYGQTKWRILTFSRSRSLTDIFHCWKRVWLSPNGVEWRIARQNRLSRFGCTLIKGRKKLKKKERKKGRTLICWVCVPPSGKIFRNQILLDY